VGLRKAPKIDTLIEAGQAGSLPPYWNVENSEQVSRGSSQKEDSNPDEWLKPDFLKRDLGQTNEQQRHYKE
jgi:hypothetical protein